VGTNIKMKKNPSGIQAADLGRNNYRAARGAVIQSLHRGLSILELIAGNPAGLTMAEVSRQIGLHTSTTFHLMRTLAALGYLTQEDGTKLYRVGPRVFQLAASAWSEVQLFNLATPILAEMAQQTGETSHLAILDRGEAIVIHKIDGSSPVRLSERVGYPRPPHCTAIGKVLVAHLPEAELKAFLDTADLKAYTPKTVTSAALLQQEMDRVRRQGYAFDDEEFAQGIRCLAAPVRSFTGQVVAAIGISGPVWRVSLDRVAELTEVVRLMAHRLSQHLGHPDQSKTTEARPVRP
jgi:DNA-binding IclR family transcriptional regulator